MLSGILIGLLVGGLGRLLVRGYQPIGCLFTLLIGVVGAIGGAALGDYLDIGGLLTFVIQVVIAAVLVSLVSLRSR